MGGLAADSLTTGSDNVAIGYVALTADTVGNKSVAVGFRSLGNQNYATATDTYNVAVGYDSGKSLTTGVQSTLIGAFAGDSITTGDRNQAFGYAALSSVEAADNNLGVGRSAGAGVTDGHTNTLVGAYNGSTGGAGQEITTGSKNTILGAYNGNQHGLDIRTLSNNIVLSDGDGNPKMIYSAASATWAAFTASGIGRINSPGGASITSLAVADDATVNLMSTTAGAAAILVYETGNGDGALFFGAYRQTTTLIASGENIGFSNSDTDGKFCVFKSANSHTITFKNRSGATRNFYFLILGAQAR